ncbi:FtsX-like permease family protein [Micromonospora sp. NPDC003197]
MFGFIWQQLRGRAGRSVALLAGVLVATTGFVVLTGTTTASRLEVTGAVERNTRAAYDILVRPKGARTPLEAERRLVQPNYLSGLFGGITTQQYDQVKALGGVDVAAPIAMLGYTTYGMPIPLDLTDAVDRSLDRQVIRIDSKFLAERGLSTATTTKPNYVYVTRNPLIYPILDELFTSGRKQLRYSDGQLYPESEVCGPPIREVLPDGGTATICEPIRSLSGAGRISNTSEREFWSLTMARLLPDGRFEQGGPRGPAEAPPTPTDRLTIPLRMSVPLLLAAVDPGAEERLVGLASAVTDGRPLTVDDVPQDFKVSNTVNRAFPVLATSRPYVDGALHANYTRLPTAQVAGLDPLKLDKTLGRATGVPAGASQSDLAASYRTEVSNTLKNDSGVPGGLNELVQAGPTGYDVLPDGTLRARAFPPTAVFTDVRQIGSSLPRPWLADDLNFRPLTDLSLAKVSMTTPYRHIEPVGMFDPEKLTGFSDLSRVPLETYEPPTAQGADAPSRTALGDQPLAPSGNPGGYLSPPPLLLTTLASVPKLLEGGGSPQLKAPISAIRVRVSDVAGYTERSAERVRLIAERIATTTGLDVDITLGSSPAPQTVELAAGKFGRPQLRLTENWSALGVASTIIRSVDRKSVVLFLLVLVVCALFLANAVSAAVRDRRSELAILACLGWPARRIGALILGEVATLGLAAGVLSLALAIPVSAALGIGIGWQRAALAVPVALLLALTAGTVPAVRASRAHPAAALRPAVAPPRRSRRPRTVLGLALVNLTRTPGRTLLGASALGIGIAALTLVTAAAYAFRGAIVGSLLGDVVSLSVRGADTVAAVATVLLGAAAVADVLYLNIRDRAAELATLQAVGWTNAALSRLVTYEGLALGMLGAVTGAAVGLAGAAWLVGDLPGVLVLVAVGTALTGVLLTGLAALVPAALLRRLPTARLLAEE